MQSWFTHFVSGSISKKPSRTKEVFISENVYVVNLEPAVMTLPFWGQHDVCDTVRYKNVANRLVTTPTFTVDAETTLGADSVTVVALKAYQRPRY